MSQSEVKNFLQLINMEVDDDYAEILFKVIPQSFVYAVQ